MTSINLNNSNNLGKINSEKKKFLKELTDNQLKNVNHDRKLHFKDFRRIIKYINSSIFDDTKCCMWDGYVTNDTNSKRGTYVNFFFKNKKVALHRLLYENFVGQLGDDYYLKFSCDEEKNCGKCCNIYHMIKYKYNNLIKNNKINTKVNNKKNTKIDIIYDNNLKITFD